jgi:hypothetical protein
MRARVSASLTVGTLREEHDLMVKILVNTAFVVITIAYALYWRRGGGNVLLGL